MDDALAQLPPAIVYPTAAFFGLTLGSFYTALASRILYYFYGPGRRSPHRWREIFFRPSHCLACGTNIHPLHLTPILGYALTGGRCASCRIRIGSWTLAGEVFPGLLFPLLLAAGWSPVAALLTVLLCGHLYISIATDWNYFVLDHENALFLILWSAASTVERGHRDWEVVQVHLLTAAVALLIFLALFFLSRMRGLGFGDVILVGVLALYGGLPWALVTVQLGAVGSIVYIYVIQQDRKAPAPLGVFLALGFFVAVVAEAIWTLLT